MQIMRQMGFTESTWHKHSLHPTIHNENDFVSTLFPANLVAPHRGQPSSPPVSDSWHAANQLKLTQKLPEKIIKTTPTQKHKISTSGHRQILCFPASLQWMKWLLVWVSIPCEWSLCLSSVHVGAVVRAVERGGEVTGSYALPVRGWPLHCWGETRGSLPQLPEPGRSPSRAWRAHHTRCIWCTALSNISSQAAVAGEHWGWPITNRWKYHACQGLVHQLHCVITPAIF